MWPCDSCLFCICCCRQGDAALLFPRRGSNWALLLFFFSLASAGSAVCVGLVAVSAVSACPAWVVASRARVGYVASVALLRLAARGCLLGAAFLPACLPAAAAPSRCRSRSRLRLRLLLSPCPVPPLPPLPPLPQTACALGERERERATAGEGAGDGETSREIETDEQTNKGTRKRTYYEQGAVACSLSIYGSTSQLPPPT